MTNGPAVQAEEQSKSPDIQLVTNVYVCLLSALHLGLFLLFPFSLTIKSAGGGLAVASLLLSARWFSHPDTRKLSIAAALLLAQSLLFLYLLAYRDTSSSLALLQATILFTYGATLMTLALSLPGWIRPNNGLLLGLSLVTSLVVFEVVVKIYVEPRLIQLGPVWVGGTVPDPILGDRYLPNTTAYNYYPDNPRGYFTTSVDSRSNWGLYAHENNRAKLEFSENDDLLEIHIDQAETSESWHIHLGMSPLAVAASREYRLSFQAKATGTRPLFISIGQNYDPWRNLGFTHKTELLEDWQEFNLVFSLQQGDDNARLQFNFGGSDESVKLSRVRLTRLDDNQPVSPPNQEKYLVEYKFNSMGCRAREYTIPPPENTLRILALGDSYTLGAGVHQQDTFSHRLEQKLNARAKQQGMALRYEVVNCGVSGYSTEQERLLFEHVVHEYQPQVVLLAMVHNDDRSWREDVEKGYFYQPGKLDRISNLFKIIQWIRHKRPDPEYSANVDEVKKLHKAVTDHNAKLAVFAFAHEPTGFQPTQRMINTLSDGLQETPIPFKAIGIAIDQVFEPEKVSVHRIDGHPNEVAHEFAASELLEYLTDNELLDLPAK